MKSKIESNLNLILSIVFIFVLLIILYGCVKVSLEDTGTVQYVNLEGGFYGIVDDNGVRFDPINLKDDFKKEGTKIKFVYSLKKDVKSIHQWGKVIEIISIRKI